MHTEATVSRTGAIMSGSRLISALLWLCALSISGVFAWILFDILRLGAAHVSLDFLVSEPTRAGRAGGIAPIIVSTLWVLAIALAAALPLGIGTAQLRARRQSPIARGAIAARHPRRRAIYRFRPVWRRLFLSVDGHGVFHPVGWTHLGLHDFALAHSQH